jgi:hypothetical protein
VLVRVTTTSSFVHGSAAHGGRARLHRDQRVGRGTTTSRPTDAWLVVRNTSQESYEHHVNVVLGWDGGGGE